MNPLTRWLLHGSNILVAGTGFIYGWMIYFMDPLDAFAIVNHPLQPELQHLHIIFAPLLVIVLGFAWQDHARPAYRAGEKEGRKSGIALLWTALPMVFSGYLLQTSVTPSWRTAWLVVHLVTSGAWTMAYLLHLLMHRFTKNRRVQASQPKTAGLPAG